MKNLVGFYCLGIMFFIVLFEIKGGQIGLETNKRMVGWGLFVFTIRVQSKVLNFKV